jgi:hypothetical protein
MNDDDNDLSYYALITQLPRKELLKLTMMLTLILTLYASVVVAVAGLWFFASYQLYNYRLYPQMGEERWERSIASPEGINFTVVERWRMPDYDLLWVVIANGSDTPFDTRAFSFNGHPLPDAPTSIRIVINDLPQLPAIIPVNDVAMGVLKLPHPDNIHEPWPLLIHFHGPLALPLSDE